MASIERRTGIPRLIALCLCALAATGCSESGETPEAIAPPAVTTVVATPAIVTSTDKPLVSATSTQSTPASDAALTTASDEAAVTPTPAEGEAAAPTVAQYQAPFPDRVDLFVPPKRQGGVRLDGESEDAVELLGFIRLDRQQVVLSINGQITPIAEGASQYGVEVISIHPPKVVLQRGRQRWQASLEN